MRIAKIKIHNGGLKGVTVEHSEVKQIEGLSFIEEHSSRYRRMISPKMREEIQSLSVSLKVVCNIYDEADAEITGYSCTEDGVIQLYGYINTDVDGKGYGICSPMIDSDVYDSKLYEGLVKKIDKINKLIFDYISGTVNQKVNQMALELIQEEAVKVKVSDEQIKMLKKGDTDAYDIARDILEKAGAIVITDRDSEEVQEEEFEHYEEDENPFNKKAV